MKRTIKLSEANLHRIIKESVEKILNEIGDTANGQYMLGRLNARQQYRHGQETGENNGLGYLNGSEKANATASYAHKKRQGKGHGTMGNQYHAAQYSNGRDYEFDRQQKLHPNKFNESIKLNRIIKESVKKVLRESNDDWIYSLCKEIWDHITDYRIGDVAAIDFDDSVSNFERQVPGLVYDNMSMFEYEHLSKEDLEKFKKILTSFFVDYHNNKK